MKTLDEHNEMMNNFHNESQENAKILCPKCKEKEKDVVMLYSSPFGSQAVNASNPPTQWVVCPECGYKGLKVV